MNLFGLKNWCFYLWYF